MNAGFRIHQNEDVRMIINLDLDAESRATNHTGHVGEIWLINESKDWFEMGWVGMRGVGKYRDGCNPLRK